MAAPAEDKNNDNMKSLGWKFLHKETFGIGTACFCECLMSEKECQSSLILSRFSYQNYVHTTKKTIEVQQEIDILPFDAFSTHNHHHTSQSQRCY